MLMVYQLREGRLEVGSLDPEAVWADLTSPSSEESALAESWQKIDLPTPEEMSDIEPSARLYTDGGAEVMTATVAIGLTTETPSKAPVTFVLRDRQLVTIRHVSIKAFDFFISRASARAPEPLTDGESVMLSLIEGLIDRYADTMEHTAAEIDAISAGVFRRSAMGRTQSEALEILIGDIGRKGDLLGMVRESLSSFQRLLAYHAALDSTARRAPRESRQKVRMLQRDAAALGELCDSMSAKLSFLLDATLGLINVQQTQIIKIFSVASVALLPPTLIASIYGMNFEYMPELSQPWGYPAALGLMVLSAGLPYLYFKKRGWL
ncbi:magnesium transporter CorA family protein [Phenylobacterium sp.]|uniref:magnesium transporter CorA family protein n=1 Tax=Phenylobacterium sp. TaxID=1871053 RepID=UPI0027307D5F|nr:magnesium transporter CorA family protein [Phenylobacterium sp.]MDP2212465.1 magnesium transporter CorA family protein [Phenylobacterium sp.]